MRVPLGPLTRLLPSRKMAFGVGFTSSDTATSPHSSASDRRGTAVIVTSTGTAEQRATSSVPTAYLVQHLVTSINVDAKVMHRIDHDRTKIQWDPIKEALTVKVVTTCGQPLSEQWAIFLTWPEARHWMENKPGGMWQYYGDRTSCRWCDYD